jgi:hypothetical protein
MRGFEVMQSYAILNDKIGPDTLKEWLRVNSAYLSKIGIISVYGMFLASLETAWIADEIADEYAKDLNVTWDREKTTTILGGINLEDTYLHILNADMGMTIYGNNDSANIFRLINSLNLPNIEEYALKPVAGRYSDNSRGFMSGRTQVNRGDRVNRNENVSNRRPSRNEQTVNRGNASSVRNSAGRVVTSRNSASSVRPQRSASRGGRSGQAVSSETGTLS